MKKMLFLVCSVLFISTLSSCGGGAGKAAKAAAGASVLIREASGSGVSFKGKGDVKYGDRSVQHMFDPYDHIPNKCRLCGFSKEIGNHY